MPKGGARNRSGPSVDPRSGRSDARGVSFTALPSVYVGDIAPFPLPLQSERESALWAQLWTYPQAAAWAAEPWRQLAVAQYVRIAVRAEDPECPATVISAVHRYADQIGLTPAGLKENGWSIAADETAARREERERPAERTAPVRRLRAAQ